VRGSERLRKERKMNWLLYTFQTNYLADVVAAGICAIAWIGLMVIGGDK